MNRRVSAVLFQTEWMAFRPVTFEFIVCFLLEMHVKVRHGRVKRLTHDTGFATRVIAPETALFFRKISRQDVTDFVELWMQSWIATKNSDESEVPFERLQSRFEVLERNEVCLTAKL